MRIIIIITVMMIAIASTAETKLRFSHITPAEEIPIDEELTVDSLTAKFDYICRIGYGQGFPGYILFLKRQAPPKRMFHRAMLRVLKRVEMAPSDPDPTAGDIRKHVWSYGLTLELLATCADRRDRRMFHNLLADNKKHEDVRKCAYFAYLFSASDEELPSVIGMAADHEHLSVFERNRFYHQIAFAYSFASPKRRTLFAEPFRDVVKRENDIRAWDYCDDLMKAFDPSYAKSEERLHTLNRFLALSDLGDGYRDYWLEGIDKAFNECTNSTAQIAASHFVLLDAYPTFISYEESILGKKPNPHRALMWTGIGAVLAAACAVAAYAARTRRMKNDK